MGIIGGLDVHRSQVTYDWVDHDTGEFGRGKVRPATRQALRQWLNTLPSGEGELAVEATTGWRFVVEEITRAGFRAHLAEPADTSAARGKKKRPKTDSADAEHQRRLLEQARLPESWIPPGHILDLRTTVRLRKTLMDARTEWQQRIHAALYHHGLPKPQGELTSSANRAWLAGVDAPESTRQLIAVGLRQIDFVEAEVAPITRWLRTYAAHQPGCRALTRHYGIGATTAATILVELGDARRFRNGDAVVRYTGLDVTVYSSDGKRSPGHLAKQGPDTLRWALFETAKLSARPAAPDYRYYASVKAREGGGRAALSVARKLARRARHTLVELGDDALTPIEPGHDRLTPAA